MNRGLSIATRGRGAGGVGNASRGYIINDSGEAPVELVTDPRPLLSSLTLDRRGTPRLLGDVVLSVNFVDVYKSPFWHPSVDYTGFAADGYFYSAGVRTANRASWAIEADSVDRGMSDGFPRRILVVLTRFEVCILDADSLDVWLRFRNSRETPPANGPFMGLSTSVMRTAKFMNGFLVLGTADGIRIADFVRDTAWLCKSGTSYQADSGLGLRNAPTFFDGITVPTQINSNDVLAVDLEVLGLLTVCAVGASQGLTGIRLDDPSASYPLTNPQASTQIVGSVWSVDDDLDSDGTSPYLIDAGTNWLADQVGVGDVVVTDLPSTHQILEVAQTVPGHRLVLTPELPLSATGATYTIRRRCPSVSILGDGTLYMANGENRVTRVPAPVWYDAAEGDIWDGLYTTFPTAKLNAPTLAINDMAVTETGDSYIATNLGIFYAPFRALGDFGAATFLYASEDVVNIGGVYKILVGSGTKCPAVAIDPETGNILVALNEEVSGLVVKSVVTEINPRTQQAFRHFDKVGIVRGFASYRNPAGPPDEAP